MLGGPTKATKPVTMYIRSGDIVVMEGPARLSYHAVPKILPDSCTLSQPGKQTGGPQNDQNKSPTDHSNESLQDDINEQIAELNQEMDKTLADFDASDYWEYLKTSRINMNIRQVLPRGGTFTEEECEDLNEEGARKKVKT